MEKYVILRDSDGAIRHCKGAYGLVCRGIRISDGKVFAMKFFGYTQHDPDISWILREIDNLRALKGKGTVQVL